MQPKPEDKNGKTTPDQLLSSLARELKNPLILMARKAELAENSSPNEAFSSIRQTAENTLRLIDSYLLAAQSEYGQFTLPIETVGIGAVIYDTVKDLREYAKNREIDFALDVKDAQVSANRESLGAILWCLSELALNSTDEGQSVHKVRIITRPEDQKVSVAVLSNQLDITDSELEMAKQLQGVSHLAGAKLSDSGIRLSIADALARSFEATISARKINGLKGFGFSLNSSRQLQLI